MPDPVARPEASSGHSAVRASGTFLALLAATLAWRGSRAEDPIELLVEEDRGTLHDPVLASVPAVGTEDGALWIACLRSLEGRSELLAGQLHGTGEGAPPDLEVISEGPGPCLEPALVATGPGSLLAVWSQRLDGDFELVARERKHGAWGPKERVTSEAGADFGAALALGPDGRVWLAHEHLAGRRSELRLLVREPASEDPGAAGWRTGGELAGAGSWSNGQPAVACAGDGQVWVAWSSWRGSYADGNYELVVERLGGGQPHLFGRPDRADLEPRLAPLAGGLALAWTSAALESVVVGELVTTGYDAFEGKLYYVCRLEPGAERFGEPERISHAPMGRRAYGDELVAVGLPEGELALVHDSHRRRLRRAGLARVRVDESGDLTVSAGLDASQGFQSEPGTRGAVWHRGALWLAENGHVGAARPGVRVRSMSDLERLVEVPEAGGRRPRPTEGEPARPPPPDLAEGPSRRPAVELAGGGSLRAWFGNLHLHSDLSRDGAQNDGPPEWNLRAVRDVAGLDFAALTDHGNGLSTASWPASLAVSELWDAPGSFVTLPGYEWSSPQYGHKNVVFRTAEGAAAYRPLSGQETGPEELFAGLVAGEAIAIPHHPSHGEVGATDWSFRDDALQRLVEIFQKRGSYEYDGAPLQRESIGSWSLFPGRSARDALAEGHRLGFIASPDHGGGPGLAGVWAASLEREAVFEALHARRTFATTGAKLALWLEVEGLEGPAPLGTEGVLVDPEEVVLRARVFGAPPGYRAVFVADGEEFTWIGPPGPGGELELIQPFWSGAESHVYLRVELPGGHIGWTSPIWLVPR